MAGAFITVDTRGFREFEDYLRRIAQKAGNAQPAFEIAGVALVTSVHENFTSQGRPDKWPDLAPATLENKKKKKKGTKILITRGMAGDLMDSIHYDAEPDKVRVGTDKIYGAIHQFGGKAGRGKKVTIPQREYLLVQDEDWSVIRDAFLRYLTD